jgi:ankyrin repeat domain-containing protein 50
MLILCSSVIIEDIRLSLNEQNRNVVAYYYFDSRDKDKQTVCNFLRWIIGQFCRTMPSLPRTVLDMYHLYRPEAPPRQVLIGTLMSLIPSAGRIYIVLDALDECSERTELVELIQTLTRHKSANINFLVTSQEERSIEVALQGIATYNIRIGSKDIDTGVKLHVRRSLTTTGKLWRWVDDAVKDEIERTLVTEAGES